jgi:hypothetical protein
VGDESNAGDALDAVTANNCYGYAESSGYGLHTLRNAMNCLGYSTGGTGMYANMANNCWGQSGVNDTAAAGLDAIIALNCYGSSQFFNGITAYIAIGCYGSVGNTNNGNVGLSTTIANSCYSSTGDGSINYKYNMP